MELECTARELAGRFIQYTSSRNVALPIGVRYFNCPECGQFKAYLWTLTAVNDPQVCRCGRTRGKVLPAKWTGVVEAFGHLRPVDPPTLSGYPFLPVVVAEKEIRAEQALRIAGVEYRFPAWLVEAAQVARTWALAKMAAEERKRAAEMLRSVGLEIEPLESAVLFELADGRLPERALLIRKKRLKGLYTVVESWTGSPATSTRRIEVFGICLKSSRRLSREQALQLLERDRETIRNAAELLVKVERTESEILQTLGGAYENEKAVG